MFEQRRRLIVSTQVPPRSGSALAGLTGVELHAALLAREPQERSQSERVDAIAGWERLIASAQAAQLAELAEFAVERSAPADAPGWSDEREAGERARWAADELAVCLSVSQGSARARLETAVRLRDLPGAHAALAAGVLTLAQARLLVEATAPLSPTAAEEVVAAVLPKAGEQTWGQLKRCVDRAMLAADPARAEAVHAAGVKHRRVTYTPAGDGMAWLSIYDTAEKTLAGYLWATGRARAARARDRDEARRAPRSGAPEDAAAEVPDRGCGTGPDARPAPEPGSETVTALHPGLDRHPWPSEAPDDLDDPLGIGGMTRAEAIAWAAGGTPDTDPDADGSPGSGAVGPGMDARRADALAGLFLWALADPALPTQARARPRIQVTVPVGSLLGISGAPALLAGYGPIPAGLARSIAADADWRRLLTDPLTGALLEVDPTIYKPPKALHDLVTARDSTCTYPACNRAAHGCELDHTIPFAEGGLTEAGNLGPQCSRHHHLKHSHGWSLSQPEPGTFVWTTPTGHTHTVTAAPAGPVHHKRRPEDAGRAA